MRSFSSVAPGWWDYTTLDEVLLRDAARLTADELLGLARPGFTIRAYDTHESFYLAEALEYIAAWPTEQLPLVAEIVNDLELDVREGHFWGMDEWYRDGSEVPRTHPLSFARADLELCFDRIEKHLRMPDSHIHFPSTAALSQYSASFDSVRCMTMQGGQGDVKHWAFNDPPKREGRWSDRPPDASEYRKLTTRVVDLHPMTVVQNARTSGGGDASLVPRQALSVGPVETWKSDRVSIWHAGHHDGPFGLRLTTLMISKRIVDTAVPMSLLAEHPDVTFNFYRHGIGTCGAEMH